jgi:hypothetical protein
MTETEINEARRLAVNAIDCKHLYRDITGTKKVADLGKLILSLTDYIQKPMVSVITADEGFTLDEKSFDYFNQMLYRNSETPSVRCGE